MTTQVRRYKQAGPSAAAINAALPEGVTVSDIVVYAPAIMDATLSDDTAAGDLDDVLAADEGWEFLDADPVAGAARTIAQIVPAALGADASAIATADGWTDVLTASITTKGGTSIGTQVTAVGSAGTTGEGQVRLVINGGSFSNVVLGPTYVSLATTTTLSRAVVAFHAPVAISAGAAETYDFKLQMQATGLLNTLTPRKGCALTCIEYL